MKKIVVIMAFIAVFVAVFAGCTPKASEQTAIEGEWQAYASLFEGEIQPFDESEASVLMDQRMIFKDGEKVVIENGDLSIEGTYKLENDEYTVTVPFGSSEKKETATFTCTFREGDLVVIMNVPEEFEGYDTGDPRVYKKVEN